MKCSRNTLESIGRKRELASFWKEYVLLKGPVGLLAFHAGAIERGTEEMANYICEKTRCSLYVFSGRLSRDNYEKLHIPSSMLDPAHSEKLSSFMANIHTAIAFHGHRIDDYILVGGLNIDLRRMIVEVLSPFRVKDVTKDSNPGYNLVRGKSSSNIINKPKNKGVQIEIPHRLRQVGHLSHEAQDVGDCIARVLNEIG